MVSTNKLKGKIVENGLSVEDVANRIGINRSTLYRKIRGEKDFTIKEACDISLVLNLNLNEVDSIFFNLGFASNAKNREVKP